MTWHKRDPGVFAQYRSASHTCVQDGPAHRQGHPLYGIARLLSWRDGLGRLGVSGHGVRPRTVRPTPPCHGRTPWPSSNRSPRPHSDRRRLWPFRSGESRGSYSRSEQLRFLVQTGSAISPRHEDCAPTKVLKLGIARVISCCASFGVTVLLRCHWSCRFNVWLGWADGWHRHRRPGVGDERRGLGAIPFS
jgi:hypothetical protein